MNTRTHEYPTALEACFDFAGREMVERWQDEENAGDIESAEAFAREYLFTLVEEGELYALRYQFANSADNSPTVVIEE